MCNIIDVGKNGHVPVTLVRSLSSTSEPKLTRQITRQQSAYKV
jgi:hypothetical protein